MFTIGKYRQKMAGYAGDCGMDLYPSMGNPHDFTVNKYGSQVVMSFPTEVSILIPDGYFAMMVGRSSSIDKLYGFEVVPGIIDSGYTGEYRIRVATVLSAQAMIAMEVHSFSLRETALAQVIMMPYVGMRLHYVDLLPVTRRGASGYGSTDSK